MALGEYTEAKVAEYLGAAIALLPPGKAWPRGADSTMAEVLEALAVIWAKMDSRAADLLAESYPGTAFELLADWERNYGIPGPGQELAPTVALRRAVLVAKVGGHGMLWQSAAFYVLLAEAVGYAIEVEEPALFEMGRSTMGDRLYSGDWCHVWIVHAPVLTPRHAKASESHAGDSIIETGNAVLEAVISAAKPAHTTVLFWYDLPVDDDAYAPWERILPPAAEIRATVPDVAVRDVWPT